MATFFKLHGAGNDFIFLEGKPFLSDDKITFLCNRRTGIGADGLIFIEKNYVSLDKSVNYSFRMHYYNSDGKEADFCANGARCSVLFAYELKYFEGDKVTFIAKDGVHKAEVLESNKELISDIHVTKKSIKLQLIKPKDLRRDIEIGDVILDFVNSGVEHSVIYKNSKKELINFSVKENAPIIRHDKQFQKGTNVNYIFKDESTNIINIRTYEKGVEDETLACGTGIAAAGYIDMLKTTDFSKRTIKALSGDILSVEYIDEYLYLTGPAVLLFKGEF